MRIMNRKIATGAAALSLALGCNHGNDRVEAPNDASSEPNGYDSRPMSSPNTDVGTGDMSGSGTTGSGTTGSGTTGSGTTDSGNGTPGTTGSGSGSGTTGSGSSGR